MEPPIALDRSLAILILRTVGCKYDDVANMVRCGKQTVAQVERWFAGSAGLSWEDARQLCDDQAIKNIVGRELVDLEEIPNEILVKAAQLTGDDILRHYRADYLQWAAEEVPPPSELVDLLQRWREQVFVLSLDQLVALFGGDALQVELLRHKTDSQRALGICDAVKGHHVQGIPAPGRVLPRVMEEGLFQRLRQQYPDDPIWEAQESWGLDHGAYWEAFVWFFAEVQRKFEVFFSAACYNYVRERGLQVDVDSVLDILGELKKEDVHLSIVLRLATVIVSCDLLTLGTEELPTNPLWGLEVDKLEMLRAVTVNDITKLPKPSPVAIDHIGTAAKLLWEHEPEIREKTKNLLGKLQNLQAVDDDLQSKLRALEWRLYGVAES